jgi:hypothetical protein
MCAMSWVKSFAMMMGYITSIRSGDHRFLRLCWARSSRGCAALPRPAWIKSQDPRRDRAISISFCWRREDGLLPLS